MTLHHESQYVICGGIDQYWRATRAKTLNGAKMVATKTYAQTFTNRRIEVARVHNKQYELVAVKYGYGSWKSSVTYPAFAEMQSRALSILKSEHPRAGYAARVIEGRQAWNGADLQGKAKEFSASYARQRLHAKHAAFAAGGMLAATDHGRLILVLRVGMDDYGTELYQSADGMLVPRPRSGRLAPFRPLTLT